MAEWDGRAGGIHGAIENARGRYYRLVLVAGHAGAGKSRMLASLAPAGAARLLSVGSALGSRLLDLTRRQRALETAAHLESLLDEAGTDPVLLDNLELLFDPTLQQDVLRLLQGLSRNRTIVAAWPGEFVDGVLSHAEPGHPEFVRYEDPEAVIVTLPPPGAFAP